MFLTIKAQCKKNHEWEMLIPNYWFSVKKCCPECNGDIVSLAAGKPRTLEQVQAGIQASLENENNVHPHN